LKKRHKEKKGNEGASVTLFKGGRGNCSRTGEVDQRREEGRFAILLGFFIEREGEKKSRRKEKKNCPEVW